MEAVPATASRQPSQISVTPSSPPRAPILAQGMEALSISRAVPTGALATEAAANLDGKSASPDTHPKKDHISSGLNDLLSLDPFALIMRAGCWQHMRGLQISVGTVALV